MSDILILGYAVLDEGYEEGKIMAVSGKDNTDSWDGDDINDPADTGYQLDQVHDQDPLLNPLVSGNNLQVLLAKITSDPPQQPSNPTTYTVLQPSNMKMTDWSVPVVENITLTYGGSAVATNPHGLAQVNNIAYIGDYDSHNIFLLKAGELDPLTSGSSHPLDLAPCNLDTLTTEPFLPFLAKGQSVIALQSKGSGNTGPVDYVFALFIVYNAEETEWDFSVLVRLIVNPADGSLSYDTHTTVGKNAQEMWPIFNGDTDADVLLLVPAIGGEQNAETTNLTDSNICAVPAFGTWPTPTQQIPMAATVLFTGDPAPDPTKPPPVPKLAKDIRVAAASTRASTDALVFIMAAGFTDDYCGADFRIYRTTAGDLFNLYTNSDPSDLPAISSLVGDELEVVREGQVYSSAEPGVPYGDYYLGLLYENADDPAGERVLQFLGSALTIDSAANFGGRSLTFGLGQGPGHIGGKNVNSAVQLAETVRQYENGLSLKRSIKATRVPSSVMVSGEDEEREDE
jgi:hypothetical protein